MKGKDNCILLDTSFFIRLLHVQDPLHINVMGYFKYFLDNGYTLKISTVSVAEYCAKGNIDELPLRNLQIIPFNMNHADRAGKLAAYVFAHKSEFKLADRRIVPNDTKLFAQADLEETVQSFATSDLGSVQMYSLLKKQQNLSFDLINIRNPYNETFGVLDLR